MIILTAYKLKEVKVYWAFKRCRMADLEKELTDKYNIDIKNFSAFRDAFLVVTSIEKLILKKSNLSSERLLFIHGAKEHLIKNSFMQIDRDICTKEGSPFLTIENCNYVLTRHIEGTECNFENKNDIINISKLLAAFHKASKGFIPPENAGMRSDLGKIPLLFSKRLDEIKKLKKVAKRGKQNSTTCFYKTMTTFMTWGRRHLT